MEVNNCKDVLPKFLKMVWCIPASLCGCKTEPFIAYRHKYTYKEKWTWRAITGNGFIAIAPEEVSQWHALTSNELDNGNSDYKLITKD